MTNPEAPCFPAEVTAISPRPWWLYQAWIARDGAAPIHFYGFLAPISRNIAAEHVSHGLPSGATLCISQRFLAETDVGLLALLQAIRGGADDLLLSSLFDGAPDLEVKHRRRVHCAFPGHSAAQAFALYGLPAVPGGLPSDQDFEAVVNRVANDTGIGLRDGQIAHMGGFDLFELPDRLEDPGPFRSQMSRAMANGHDSLIRVWRVSQDEAEWIAQIQVTGDGEVLWDGLKFPEPGSGQVEVHVNGVADGFSFAVFDKAGHLLHREECAFIREIGIDSKTLGRTLVVGDRLAHQAASQGKKHPNASGSVATKSQISSVMYDPSGLRNYRMRMRDHLEEVAPTLSDDRWFYRSLDEELGVIAHLNQLLDSGSIESAVIVDPFFGPDAIERLLTRLSSDSLQLTIVSGWGKTDLNTAKPLSAQDVQSERLVKQDLPAMLNRFAPLLSVRLRFLNLVDSDGKPAFHDRYLLLRTRAGERRVYLLSNSINNLAVNWPFCMSLLSGQARRDAALYIEGLCQGHDTTQSTTPKINFEWPAPTGPGA